MGSSSELSPLFDEFPPVSTEAWAAKIREDLGASDPDAVLEWSSVDGISLPAFGRREDLGPLPHVSEAASASPLVGDDAPANRWRVRLDLRHPDLDAARQGIDLARDGAVADLGLLLGSRAGPDSTLSVDTPAELRALLDGVPLDEVSLHLGTGPDALVLLALLERAYDRPLPALLRHGTVAYDPVGALAVGAAHDESRAVDGIETILDATLADDTRALHVDLRPYHEAGASAVQELACGLGALSDLLARLLDRGRSLTALLPRLHVTTATSTSYFVEIAKLRALRLLVPQVIGAYADEAGASVDYAPADLLLQVETSRRSETLYDPHVNMLRATTEAMAAVLGGCDVLAVRPFDGQLGPPDRFGLRIARNVQLILRHEAHFDQVADPAAGAYYVEAATDALAERAWDAFRDREARGGLIEALRDGRVQADIAAVREERRDAVNRRDQVLVGTNHYPNPSETRLDDGLSCNNGTASAHELDVVSVEALQTALHEGAPATELVHCLKTGSAPFSPLPSMRVAEGIERLRRRTEQYAESHHRPVALLAPLGPPRPRSARATFARHVFGAAGFDVREPLAFEAPAAAAAAADDAGADLLVLCGADAEYPTLVPALRAALDDRSLDPLLVVAGAPDQISPPVSADVFIHEGRSLRDTLIDVQRRLGVRPDDEAAA